MTPIPIRTIPECHAEIARLNRLLLRKQASNNRLSDELATCRAALRTEYSAPRWARIFNWIG